MKNIHLLSRKFEYGNSRLSEQEIEEINTGYFQFATDENNTIVYLLVYDGNNITTKKLKNSDVGSFQVLSMQFAKDKNNIYMFGKIIKKMDASSFEFLFDNNTLTEAWSKDKNNLYCYDKVVKNIDGKTFCMLNKFWGKDDKSVYSFALKRLCKTIDTNSFKIIDKQKAEDKNYYYDIKLKPYIHVAESYQKEEQGLLDLDDYTDNRTSLELKKIKK